MISPSLTHVKKRCQQYPCACGFICDAKIPNNLSGAVVGEWSLYLSSYLVVLISFPFLSFYLHPRYPWGSYPLRASLSYGIYSVSFLTFFLLPLPPLPQCSLLSETFLLLRVSSSSHRLLSTQSFHLSKNSVPTLSLWFGIFPSLG